MSDLRPETEHLATPEGNIVLATHRLGLCLFVQAGPAPGRLTAREAEFSRLYAGGTTHRQIADVSGLAPVTVRNVLQKVYGKLQVRNKPELLRGVRSAPEALR